MADSTTQLVHQIRRDSVTVGQHHLMLPKEVGFPGKEQAGRISLVAPLITPAAEDVLLRIVV